MTMQLDHEQLHQLLDKLAESDIQEFRLEGDDFRLEVRRNLPGQPRPHRWCPLQPLPLRRRSRRRASPLLHPQQQQELVRISWMSPHQWWAPSQGSCTR